MRKIESQMLTKIRECYRNSSFSGEFWKNSNTKIVQEHIGTYGTVHYNRFIQVYLYGHKIAEFNLLSGNLTLSNCGYTTATTKSRLNALIHNFTNTGGIYQKDYQWYYGHGEEFDRTIEAPFVNL